MEMAAPRAAHGKAPRRRPFGPDRCGAFYGLRCGGRYIEIQPKALAMELMRMTAAKKGQRKRIMA